MYNNGTPEKIEGALMTFIKWLAVVVVILGIIGGLFWLVFYSPFLANNNLVIPVRNQYSSVYSNVAKTTTSQDNSPYAIQPQRSSISGENAYTLTGTYAGFDYNYYILYVKTSRSQIYAFDVRKFIYTDTQKWLKVYKVPDLKTLVDGKEIDQNSAPPADISGFLVRYNQYLLDDSILSNGLKNISVRWNDPKTLSQIEARHLGNSNEPLNAIMPDSIVLAQIVN